MFNEVIKLKDRFGRICATIGEIPTSFKQSLTYEEQLIWFCNYLENTVIPAVNNNAEILEAIQEYVKTIDVNFEKLEKEILDMQYYVDSKIEEQNQNITLRFNEMYNSLLNVINDFVDRVEGELNYQVTLLNNRIDQIEIGEINVYNPTSGNYENINKVLTDIYDSVRYDAITASEFDALELTATEFDAVEITAYNFDNNGKSILSNL